MVRISLIVVAAAVYAAASIYGGFFYVFTDNAELNRLLRDVCKLVSLFSICLFVISLWIHKATVRMNNRIAYFESKVTELENATCRPPDKNG